MRVFDSSQNFVLNNAHFVDQSVNHHGPNGIDVVREASFLTAAHDSIARQYAASCYPGTRAQYIEDITRWAISPSSNDPPSPIYWMKGPAGVGKSAIAQTCAEKLKDLGRLGASFFFSVNGCDDHTRFFPSIAYQLAIIFPEYREVLDKKVLADLTLVKKAMKAQFRGLLVEPLEELQRNGKLIDRRAIIIDGLDECSSKDAQCEIVNLVGACVRENTMPLCWAFFTRPEPHLQSTFTKPVYGPFCKMAVLPVSREADKEIELYLRSGLENTLQRRNISLSYAWPSDRDIKILVTAAAGLFIYPATIIRFMGEASQTPEELLTAVLSSSKTWSSVCDESFTRSPNQPFAELDAFYTLILQRIPSALLPSVQLLLALAFMTPFESCIWGTVGLGNLLGFSEAKFRLICSELHAVLHFQEFKDLPALPRLCPKVVDATCTWLTTDMTNMRWLRQNVSRLGGVLTFYHKSFYDFLGDPTRSKAFCVSNPQVLGELFKLRLGIHLNYAARLSLRGQRLIEMPDISGPVSLLSWPQDSDIVNSYIKAVTFNNTGFALLHVFYPYDNLDFELVKQLGEFDFQKHLLSQSYIFPDGYVSRSTIFGSPSMAKYIRGPTTATMLCGIPPNMFHLFDYERFQKGLARLESYKVIRRVHFPDLLRWKCRFRSTYSGLYKKGYGEKKTFWYWELNFSLRYYREFETGCLVEGEQKFREEDFSGWGI